MLLFILLLMAWGGTAHAAVNRTAAQDTHALAALKDCVYDGKLEQSSYLRSWRSGSDPCSDGWYVHEPHTLAAGCHVHPPVYAASVRQSRARVLGVSAPEAGREPRRHGVWCAPDDSGALRVRGVRLVGLSLHGDLGQWEIADGELSVGHASVCSVRVYDGECTTCDRRACALQALESLDLSSNVFRGTIPASLSRLRRLEFLSLGVNVLYGTLPPELGELSRLKRFDIDGGFNDQQVLVQAWYAPDPNPNPNPDPCTNIVRSFLWDAPA